MLKKCLKTRLIECVIIDNTISTYNAINIYFKEYVDEKEFMFGVKGRVEMMQW